MYWLNYGERVNKLEHELIRFSGIVSANTITNNEAEVFDGFEIPVEKTYQVLINGQTKTAKIKVTQ